MMGALAFLVYGYAPAERFVALGSTITAIGIACFVLNVLINLKASASISFPSRDLHA
ncbi:MAG: hypothetical protein L5657_06690 [Calditerricola sp.]|nr:hypothetical protein [Calditerricola sp.]